VRLARGPGRPISAVASDLAGSAPQDAGRTWVRQDEADDGTRADRLAAADHIAYVAIAHTTPAGAVSDHWPIVLDLSTPSEVATTTP